MNYVWNYAKDKLLQRERGVTFLDVVEAISEGKLLDDMEHPNQEKFNHQHMLVVEICGYAYYVPYVMERDGTRFLKTIYPSRKATSKYLTN